MTIANSLDPAQARQNVGPDLDLTCLTLGWYSRNNFSKNLILKQISRRQKVIRLPSIQTCAILRLKGQDYRNYKELQYIYSCPMKTRHSTHALSYGLSKAVQNFVIYIYNLGKMQCFHTKVSIPVATLKHDVTSASKLR